MLEAFPTYTGLPSEFLRMKTPGFSGRVSKSDTFVEMGCGTTFALIIAVGLVTMFLLLPILKLLVFPPPPPFPYLYCNSNYLFTIAQRSLFISSPLPYEFLIQNDQ